jgi:uncharacterized protein (TIGR02147 family)
LKDIFNPTGKQRGMQTKLARHMNCQSSYINQVIKGKLNLSLEQAIIVADFLQLTNDQSHYFMLLVQFERAGSKILGEYYKKQIQMIKEDQKTVSSQIKGNKDFDLETKIRYYSSWIYAAIHILTSVPDFQTPILISQKLGISLKITKEVLNFLLKSNLVKRDHEKWVITNTRMHLRQNDPLIVQHHFNWREQAMNRISLNQEDDLHYSLIFSISKQDYQLIRTKLLEFIKEIETIYGPSPEEELSTLCFDLSQLGTPTSI